MPELTATIHPARRGAALPAAGVVTAGFALAVTALLPWVGVTAEVGIGGAEFTRSVRGVDYGAGWFVMAAGVAAMLLGVLGLVRSRLCTMFAILPGAVAAFALAMFLADPWELADRLGFRIPGPFDIHPSIQYGWIAGLLASVAVAVLAFAATPTPRPAR